MKDATRKHSKDMRQWKIGEYFPEVGGLSITCKILGK